MNKYKSIEQLNKNFVNAFSSPTTVQAFKSISAISNFYPNTGVSESLKQAMAFTSKSNIYQNNFSGITSALTSYTASTKQYSAITNIASSAQIMIKSTEALRKSPIFYNQSEISKMIANATRTNMQSAIAWDKVSKIINGVSPEKVFKITPDVPFQFKNIDKYSNDSTCNLESSKTISETKKRKPAETSTDDDINVKYATSDSVDLSESFQEIAFELFDDGYTLPSVAEILVKFILGCHNVVVKTNNILIPYFELSSKIIFISGILYYIYQKSL
ncbi:hypothetical protein PS421_08555 [Pediococcus pentosaceus]|uniref:hypothetical protein n=1 Tax=Pediococcus pentosaceus TaxID=1255 RepID=UPI002F266429